MRLAWYGLFFGALILGTGACGDDRECISHQATFCHEDVTYWSNSCGDLEEIVETCRHGCNADHSACRAAPLSVRIASPAANQPVHDVVRVDVVFSGPIVQVELLAGSQTAGQQVVAAGATSATMDFDSTTGPDGTIALQARIVAEDGRLGESARVEVLVDNTAPQASFGEYPARLDVLTGVATILLSVQEPNLASLTVAVSGQEIVQTQEIIDEFVFNTRLVPDGIHQLVLEVTDLTGHSIRVEGQPLVVVNDGEEVAVTYSPSAELSIPENWQSIDHHIRTSVTSQPGIQRIISWVKWDASAAWDIEYAVGQGLCPHRGIRYQAVRSSGGEIVIDLDRSELEPHIVANLPTADQESTVFPHNNDPRTFGAFFGHVAVMDPAEHVNQTLPVEVHYVFLFAR